MNLQGFKATLALKAPPEGLSGALTALWWDAKGDWHKAHEFAQRVEDDRDGQWVHAYLHRREGDLSNAGYWYKRAGKPAASTSLEAEWEAIARALLSQA
jgi:hypothetical protein